LVQRADEAMYADNQKHKQAAGDARGGPLRSRDDGFPS